MLLTSRNNHQKYFNQCATHAHLGPICIFVVISQNLKSLQWWYIYCFMLRTLYNKIMANYSISLAIYEWIERERATDEDGRQTHAFLLGCCYRPHWVRRFLAVGGPGCCLVKVVLGTLVAVRLFHYSSGWHTSHPCAIHKMSWRASASLSWIILFTFDILASTS